MFHKKIIVLGAILLSACGVNDRYQQTLQLTQPATAFIAEKSPTLPPYGYVQFCNDYPSECPEKFNRNAPATSMMHQQATASTKASMQPLSPFNLTRNLHRLLQNNMDEKQQFTSIIDLLKNVNDEVNNSIMQVTDLDGFGVVENWRIPNMTSFISDIGDCEDFALAKRKILIDRYGFNRNALSMSVLRRPAGDVHAVLMVRTSYGDYILDNLEDEVLLWNNTGYNWIKKQSFGNPSQWISL